MVLNSCSTKTLESRNALEGYWKVIWETLPESYPGMEGMNFKTDGSMNFTGDSVTITINGFRNCIFNEDTLTNTTQWKISNDTLYLVNDDGEYGMSYIITSMRSSSIDLKLMDDIFLHLTK